MEGNITGILITIIVYLGGMILIGAVFSKKNKDVSDFYLGGRKLGPLVSAMSAEASDMSSWLLLGLPGVAYLCGLAEAGWTAIGLAIGTYLNWLFVAKRLRVYSQKTGSITIPDFFSDRYHDDKHLLSGVAAVIILIFFVPYTASGFSACGKLFGTLFGMDYHTAMILAAVIIIAYTSMGGFLAASFTDLIQSIIMTTALVIIVCFGISNAGGWDAVMNNAKALPDYLHLTVTRSLNKDGSFSQTGYGFLPIVSTMAWGLGYFGMPHILLRFMAIEDEKKIRLSRRIASVWVVIAMTVAIVIGFIGNQLSANGKLPTLFGAGTDSSETVVMEIAKLLSQHSFVAAIVAG
ncbi:MAG: sodium/proline symporter, partial [Oscillospiraceae bacterium]|nr:sodium/proline symporter [Oscillospiraceae bacterium]